MTADVATSLKDWSATASSNQPDNSDAVGPNTLAENQRTIQSVVRAALAGGDTIASATTTDIGAKDANYLAVSGTTTITGLGTVSSGIIKILKFDGILTFTHNGTSLILPGAANITTAAGDIAIMRSEGSGNWRCLFYGNIAGLVPKGAVTTSGLTMATDRLLGRDTASTGAIEEISIDSTLTLSAGVLSVSVFPKNYLASLILSTAGSSTTITVSAGQAADSTNAVLMSLAAPISKTTGSWAVGSGNGGLDTGVIANSTTYHHYLIRRPDTGVVDEIFSLSASSPTLPANYTQFRHLYPWQTNGSGQWVKGIQNGDMFTYDAAIIDIDAVNPGTSAVTRTLSVPTGLVLEAVLFVGGHYASSAFTILASALSVSDQAPQAIATGALSGFSSSSAMNSVAGWNFVPQNVITNTSAQIRTRLSDSGASDRLGIITRGFIYRRGRDA